MAALPLPLRPHHTPLPDSLHTPPLHAIKPAQRPFVYIPQRSDDVVAWTSSIARHCRSGSLPAAVRAFSGMKSAGVRPNHVTLVTLLSACADDSAAAALALGTSLHGYACKLGFHADDVKLGTAVVDLYAKCGRMDVARRVFDRMAVKNSVTFNAMIDGYVRNGDLEMATLMFNSMATRDKVSWTALMGGLVKNGLFEEALDCFREMQMSEVDADYVTLLMVLTACANLGAIGSGLWVHRFALWKDLLVNVRLCNALVDMYSRCGFVDLASQVFDQMRERSAVSWNSIIVGFAINGRARDALERFVMMQEAGFKPDAVTFTGVLTACSHGGMLTEGLRYYDEMQTVHRIPPRIEHYGCVIDLLSRVGLLDEAVKVVEDMPIEPNEVILGSLLAACRVHGDVKLAERLVGYLFELEPGTDSSYVLLSNIYAAAGRWDHAGEVRMAMKKHGVKKRPGFSSIEINGCMSEFVAGDKSQHQSGEIRTLLDQLTVEMKLDGYVPEIIPSDPD